MADIDKIFETKEFATLPAVAVKLLNLLDKPDFDVNEISKIIESDATLTMKLLYFSNSPIFASNGHINSIHQAVLTLGLNRLLNIVLGVLIFSQFVMSTQSYATEYIQKFWWHSACTSMVAKALAKKLRIDFHDSEFIGGLLHDIGKLALIQYDAVKFSMAANKIQTKNITECEAERMYFKTDHLEIGSRICEYWKLPNSVYEVITYHNQPLDSVYNPGLTACVRIADLLCEIWGAGIDEGYISINLKEEDSWLILSRLHPEIGRIDLAEFSYGLENEFKKAKEFLNLISE